MSTATPVLIVGFNRPHLLAGLIERLSVVQPLEVYVAIDGPRADRPDDAIAVSACQEVVTQVNWPCTIHTRFNEANLGCGRAVSSAISWFLDSVDHGIILEDDVVPDPSFFEFCTTVLERYAEDDRVLAVSGSSLVPASGQTRSDLPYRFSQVPNVWGWALWRRTWGHYTHDISDWRSMISTRTLWEATGGSATGTLLWGAWFDMVANGEMDTWDIQLVLTAMRCGQLTATSNVQLTENIGFGSAATHQTLAPAFMPPLAAASFPLVDVPVEVDTRADAWARRHQLMAEVRVQHILQRSSPGFSEFIEEVREVQRTSAR